MNTTWRTLLPRSTLTVSFLYSSRKVASIQLWYSYSQVYGTPFSEWSSCSWFPITFLLTFLTELQELWWITCDSEVASKTTSCQRKSLPLPTITSFIKETQLQVGLWSQPRCSFSFLQTTEHLPNTASCFSQTRQKVAQEKTTKLCHDTISRLSCKSNPASECFVQRKLFIVGKPCTGLSCFARPSCSPWTWG